MWVSQNALFLLVSFGRRKWTMVKKACGIDDNIEVSEDAMTLFPSCPNRTKQQQY